MKIPISSGKVKIHKANKEVLRPIYRKDGIKVFKILKKSICGCLLETNRFTDEDAEVDCLNCIKRIIKSEELKNA